MLDILRHSLVHALLGIMFTSSMIYHGLHMYAEGQKPLAELILLMAVGLYLLHISLMYIIRNHCECENAKEATAVESVEEECVS